MIYKEYIVGKQTENRFAKFLNKFVASSKEEDIHEHWDLKAVIDGVELKFDVKGLKRQNRYDIIPNENFHWVELVNVLGNKGWLYGQADAFVFETEDYWLLVDKMVLQKFMDEKTNGKVLENTKDPYTLYQRKGRKDIVVKVKTLDLMRLSFKCIEKVNDDEQTNNQE